jgi:hypothetical protein
VSSLTRLENDDVEHDLVEESRLRTVHWIGDNFAALKLPASAFCV